MHVRNFKGMTCAPLLICLVRISSSVANQLARLQTPSLVRELAAQLAALRFTIQPFTIQHYIGNSVTTVFEYDIPFY